jgi:hypothetical protein
MSRMPGTNTSWNFAPGAISAAQVSASQPFAIEPPETLEKIPILASTPVSCSRHSAPVWNSIAR